MNPIESRHHLKADEYFRFREGVVLNRPVKANQGSWADIGLKKVKFFKILILELSAKFLPLA